MSTRPRKVRSLLEQVLILPEGIVQRPAVRILGDLERVLVELAVPQSAEGALYLEL